MPRAKLIPAASEATFASVMDKLSEIYVKALPFKKKVKEFDDEAKEYKEQAIKMMDAQGVVKTTTKDATISITELERVVIDDLPTMLKALKRDGWEHIITLNVPAAQEYMEKKGKAIPGTHVTVTTRFIKLSGISR